MLLAIIQSALWLFVLPPICKAFWPRLFLDDDGGISAPLKEVLLNMSSSVLFISYALLVALPPYVLRWEFFERYKIADGVWPWQDERVAVRESFWTLSRRSVFLTCFNLLVFIPVLTYSRYLMFPQMTPPSFSLDDWPTPWESLVKCILLTLVHEFGFYWSHRLMHTYPRLYKYHKVHHEYKANNILAAQHNHPVDYLLSIGGPALLSTAIVHAHAVTQLQWFFWILVANFDDHLGYAFPWSPVRWFPFAASTDMHEFHHAVNMGCFGSKLSLYDKIFSSDVVYEKWKKKREQKHI